MHRHRRQTAIRLVGLIGLLLSILSLAPVVWAQTPAPPEDPGPFDWKLPLAAAINTAGVMVAVWLVKRASKTIRERVPWLLPILAGAFGPAVAAAQAALTAWLGVPIDLSGLGGALTGGVATGAMAVLVHQVYKQAQGEATPRPLRR